MDLRLAKGYDPAMSRMLFLAAAWVLCATGNARAERTIHVFGVFCDAYPAEAGAINEGVTADRLIVNQIFTEFVSPVAWGVQVRKVYVSGEEATKAGIESEWAAFSQGIGADDTVYVHFSGHGVIRDRAAGEQFLQACDLQEISREAWAKQIEALPCRLKILVTDCCSTYIETEVAEGNADVIPWKTVYYLLMKHEGFVNITAASPGQPAYGLSNGGFLTVNLASDIQRFRTWKEVFDATRERVFEESSEQIRAAGGADALPQQPFAYSLGTPQSEITEEDAAVAHALEYVFEDSATRYLSADEIVDYGLELLYLGRNEIFARHGYEFKSEFLRNYFESQSWYQAIPGFKNPSLSAVEKANVSTILAVEKENGGPYLGSTPVLPGQGGGNAPPDIFPWSSERALSRTVVQTLTLPELSIARNEIFARHGYPFAAKALREHFGKKPWYVRDASATSPDFNAVEKHNLWLIEKIERIQGGPHRW